MFAGVSLPLRSPPCDFEYGLTVFMSLTPDLVGGRTRPDAVDSPEGGVAPNWQLGWVSSWLRHTTDFLCGLGPWVTAL